jgi:dienelactone hydrolase
MAEVLLFHHALGLTPGVASFAELLREAGHVVHAPDLYDGKTFSTIEEGVRHAEELSFDAILERGGAIAGALPSELVYAGMSLGAMPAQKLAMTRPGARGALILHSAVPLKFFGGVWPPGVPAQIHTMENDSWGDVDVARELDAAVDELELFLYPGDRHLFTDASLPDQYEAEATALVTDRVLGFLASV